MPPTWLPTSPRSSKRQLPGPCPASGGGHPLTSLPPGPGQACRPAPGVQACFCSMPVVSLSASLVAQAEVSGGGSRRAVQRGQGQKPGAGHGVVAKSSGRPARRRRRHRISRSASEATGLGNGMACLPDEGGREGRPEVPHPMECLPAGNPAVERDRGRASQRAAQADRDQFRCGVPREAGLFRQVLGVIKDEAQGDTPCPPSNLHPQARPCRHPPGRIRYARHRRPTYQTVPDGSPARRTECPLS